MATEDRAKVQKIMNVNRLIWITTTLLFGLVGAMLGSSLGKIYVTRMSTTAKLNFAVTVTIAAGVAVVAARVGSWFAGRHIIPGLRHLHQVPPADRVLGITGALLGLLFGVLVVFPLPRDSFWLPIQFCAMAASSVLGMALLQGMRTEMLRVFPRLEETSEAAASSCKPKLLDTNIIIDGRMADICKTGFVEGPMFVPSFVLEEVQYIADSPDSLRRARGRRGLEVLNVMRELAVTRVRNGQTETTPVVQVLSDISPAVRKVDTVDSKLVYMAKEMGAVIVTNDFNLNRVAELQGVKVLNLNELAQALKPVVLPGEEMNLTIVKEGKEPGQGIGYLEDGTMVVVGDGQRHIGETCKVVITSTIQTLAGKMIFAEMKTMKGSGEDLFEGSSGSRKGGESSDDLGNRAGSGVRRKGRP
ncbi:MAG TPA: PIN domain-containing protein [Abditibacteriaceae bacterium]|nr:PIN domain-containing protein [Abditibacteriaceae bacterium]